MAESLSQGLFRPCLTLGIPFYGRGWHLQTLEQHGLGAPATSPVFASAHTKQVGVWACYEICQWMLTGDVVNMFDPTMGASYTYSPLWWISYNDVATVRTKVQLSIRFRSAPPPGLFYVCFSDYWPLKRLNICCH